ncbi:hypothetical protein CRI64_00105 [Escherichia sp. E2748]|nr:hypothetical protein CRI64_00105 [Escherichia sp. E2748]
MVNLISHYDNLFDMNQSMLTMVREEKWDAFLALLDIFLAKAEDLITGTSGLTLSEIERERIKSLVRELMNGTEELIRKVNIRLETLKQNMTSLHQGSKVSQMYTFFDAVKR